MIEGREIVCFSNDWHGDPLSKKHIVLRLANRNRILWVNSIGNRNPTVSGRDIKRIVKKLWEFTQGPRRVAENIYLFTPLAIPFHGNGVARRVNKELLAQNLRHVCNQLGFTRPITWTFLPTSAEVVGALGEELIVYQCVDEFSQFTGTDKAAILEMERKLMKKADAVIVSSERLYRSKRSFNPNTFLVTHGVDVEHFRSACDPRTPVPADLSRLKRPRVGFYGLIEDWVDLRLIRYLALSKPQWSFVLIGKVATDTSPVRSLPNVHFLGRKEYQLLPSYSKGFDVAILPFVINELTLAANPLKVREYLAAGLPVVATPIPEVERFMGQLRIGKSYAHFLSQVEAVIAEGQIGPRLSISSTMDNESWDHKVEEISQIITGLESPMASKKALAS